jgi:hypothetical protein
MTLHLTLTHHWYDETVAGRKRIEYRAPTQRWMRQIYERRFLLHEVVFHRAYTSTTATYRIDKIDLGECPIAGWEGKFIRIHFSD